jgi:hypothetical protein
MMVVPRRRRVPLHEARTRAPAPCTPGRTGRARGGAAPPRQPYQQWHHEPLHSRASGHETLQHRIATLNAPGEAKALEAREPLDSKGRGGAGASVSGPFSGAQAWETFGRRPPSWARPVGPLGPWLEELSFDDFYSLIVPPRCPHRRCQAIAGALKVQARILRAPGGPEPETVVCYTVGRGGRRERRTKEGERRGRAGLPPTDSA